MGTALFFADAELLGVYPIDVALVVGLLAAPAAAAAGRDVPEDAPLKRASRLEEAFFL